MEGRLAYRRNRNEVQFSIPVYVEGATRSDPYYSVRPLFLPHLVERGPKLERTLTRLTQSLRRELEQAQNLPRQDELGDFLFAPVLREKLVELRFGLGKRTAECRLLVVCQRAFDRWLGHLPGLYGLWFELARWEELEERVREVVVGFFRSHPDETPEASTLSGRAWTTTIELNVAIGAPRLEQPGCLELFLGGAAVGPGASELEKVGYNLEDLLPDALLSCQGRESELGRLQSLMEARSRAPVVVLGPPLVGKTSLVHQTVRGLVKESPPKRRFWQLSPQRLIAGMSYLGQWEKRLLAIIDHAIENDLILYFDNLPGLWVAGRSRDCDLSLIDVMRPFLERRQLRVLAESSASGWARLGERDRGLIDQFQRVHLHPPTRQATLRILLGEQRRCEREFECRVGLEALEAVYRLGDRYQPHLSFPGKGVRLLRQTALANKQGELGRAQVLRQFETRTGLNWALLDESQSLSLDQVHHDLSGPIAGQEEVVGWLTDLVVSIKSGLCEPGRPLANLLFVGPTGVGKTHTARVLASYLFGSEERLVRFDMNEYLSPASISRLIGSPEKPVGLLAAAVRRQPYCVVLLDEIEKAHADVFDLLLAVLGDGRLTDSLGQTADFSQCVIIMTSNLGAEQAGKTFGLRSRDHEVGLAYRKAAQDFFSPEFFNRLDEVLAFGRLPRNEVRKIAGHLIEALFHRSGLRRRQCILAAQPEALENLVERGYDPELGARALKREVERHITAPLAQFLASIPGQVPAILALRPGNPVEVEVKPLISASAELSQRRALGAFQLESLERELESLESEVLEPLAPDQISEQLSHQQLVYFAARDQIRRLRAGLRNLSKRPRTRDSGPTWLYDESGQWRQLFQHDLAQRLGQIRSLALEQARRDDRLPALIGDLAMLCHILEELAKPSPTRAEVRLDSLSESPYAERLTQALQEAGEAVELGVEGLTFDGLLSRRLLASEVGLHLFRAVDGSLHPIQLSLVDEQPSSSVRRVYDLAGQTVVDLRCGWVEVGSEPVPSAKTITMMILRGLEFGPSLTDQNQFRFQLSGQA